MNKIVKGILVLGILLLLSTSCGIYQDANQPIAEKLTILESKLVPVDVGYFTIQGQAKNISNRQLKCAEIRGKFYDNNGTLVKSSRTNTLQLMPNEIWGFEILYIGDRPIAKYEISIVTAY